MKSETTETDREMLIAALQRASDWFYAAGVGLEKTTVTEEQEVSQAAIDAARKRESKAMISLIDLAYSVATKQSVIAHFHGMYGIQQALDELAEAIKEGRQ